jgi:TldD protein
MDLKRREFLGGVAAGSAILTMPAFLTGCGVTSATTTATATPENPFLTWFGMDQATISRVMAGLTVNGADIADLYFQHQRANLLRLEDGVVSRADSEILQGVGLRVVVGGQTGYAFTEDLTLPSMLAAARTAAAIAASPTVTAPQAFNPKSTGDLYRTEVAWADVDAERKLPLLQRVDRMARSADPSISKVSVHWADADERILIATLDGHLIMDHRPMTRLSAQITATRDGEVQSGFSNIAAREEFSWYTDERIDRMVREAIDRTLILFEASRPPAGEMPVILAAGASGILLHEAIGHSMEGDFNRKGTSVYSDMIGKPVAEPFVTIVDQGTLPRERGALNYDDEGNACGRAVMVENGVLRSYLHDAISARHYEVPTTGSGRRQSYRFPPMPRMTCTFMEDGPHTRDEIVAAVDTAIIAETYTDGQVRIGAGDYRFHVKNGWLVEKGRITAPIRDVNIIGNGPESLRRITMVANDGHMDTGGWTCGKNGQRVPVSQGMPTVLVSRMTVSGENAD